MRKSPFPNLNLGNGIFEEEIEIISENWNLYRLGNGTIIKMKTVLTSVVRFDKVPRPDGQPTYFVNSQNVVDYFPPEEAEKNGTINQPTDPNKILS